MSVRYVKVHAMSLLRRAGGDRMIRRLRALVIDLLARQADTLALLELAEKLVADWRKVAEMQEATARAWRQRAELTEAAVDPILLGEMLSTLADIDALDESDAQDYPA